ncbi:hypothetical protein TIFTF001_028148 [Ficus carica]|uniref:Uncharacterized protein n=1 Tax=Ficus carica TaxID=3494 RepID=A0AA88J196_FICCA|nr:hypothetical protein TIFTF001_028148 [Ficus carica]
MASAEKRPPVEKNPKKPAPEKTRKLFEEGLKRKHGENKVEESKKAKRTLKEKNADVEEKPLPGKPCYPARCLPPHRGLPCIQVLHNIVMHLTDHSRMGDALWAYESIPIITGKFTTKHVEANPRMLSWTSSDNVKFDAVIEMNEPCVAQLYLKKKDPTIVSQAPCKTPVMQSSIVTNSNWLEFQKKIREEVDSMNKKLEKLIMGQKKSRKLLYRVPKLLCNLNDKIKGNPTTAYHVSYRHKRNAQNDDLNAMKNDYDDLRFGPQDNGFLDFDFDIANKGVKAVMDFLNGNKTKMKKRMRKRKKMKIDEGENDEEDEDEEGDKEKEDEKMKKRKKEEGEAKDKEEKKYENDKENEEKKKDEAAKEIEEERKDEKANGDEEEINDEEAAMEQDIEERNDKEIAKEQEENINDYVVTHIHEQKRSRLSRVGQKRSRLMVEGGSAAYAPTKMVKVSTLP